MQKRETSVKQAWDAEFAGLSRPLFGRWNRTQARAKIALVHGTIQCDVFR